MKRHGNYRDDAAIRHPLYTCWEGIKRRCYAPTCKEYVRYGARGITVCDAWLASFSQFASDMGARPPGHSLERKDNNGPYSAENCVWATPKQQSANTRKTRLITFRGETLPLREWARRIGIDKNSLKDRLKRWPLHEALTEPANVNRPKHR